MDTRNTELNFADYGSFEKRAVKTKIIYKPEHNPAQNKLKIETLKAFDNLGKADKKNQNRSAAFVAVPVKKVSPVQPVQPAPEQTPKPSTMPSVDISDFDSLTIDKSDKKQKKAKKEKQKGRPAAKSYSKEDKVKRPIGVRLVFIISLLVLFSMGLITVLASYYITNETKINAEDNNLTINSRAASDCKSRLESVISSAGLLYDMMLSDSNGENFNQISTMFFDRNKSVEAVTFIISEKNFYNRQFFLSNELETSLFDLYVSQENDSIEKAMQGIVKIQNASPFFGSQILAVFTPVYYGAYSDVAVVLYSCDELSESFASSSINSSILLNDEGIVLVHPDVDYILQAKDLSDNEIVHEMLNSNQIKNREYISPDGEKYLAAYRKIGIGNCGVVTEVKTSIVLAGINRTTTRNIYLTISILSISIILIWFFSKSLSNPLKTLTAVVNDINRGNFNTDKFEDLSNKRKDEIGVLIQSTKKEREILNTVTQLTNRGVTEAIVKEEIDFNPHLKDITIFFSDIRGFTAISDGFNKRFGEKSAAEIISFLNDYMGRMVNCINITGGNVDKFEGDAIMACWGVLRDDDLSYEQLPDSDPAKEGYAAIHNRHVRQDALSAIKATVAMRYSLMEYNKHAEIFTKEHANEIDAKYKPHIRIGSGLNSGRATVGFMGSYHKMEFTSIGDAVNLASRTESSNKPCGTDILITQDTYDILKYDYIKCQENNFTISPDNAENEVIVEMIPVAFEVKGKGKQHFYGVVNMPGFDVEAFFKKADPNFKVDEDCIKAVGPTGPKTLKEVRLLLGIPEPNFDEVDLDAAEEKTKASSK